MSDKTTLLLTTLLVTVGAIANLARFFWNISIVVGTLVLPGWTGALFFIALGLLATWSFRALGGLCFPPPINPPHL